MAEQKILIVEDVDHIRLLIKKTLERAGYEVEEATNGKEALKAIQLDEEIYLILLDYMMPRMSGIDFLKRVKEFKREYGFYVLMLTAKSTIEDIKECLVAGADDYIIKPMDRDILLEKVKLFFDQRGMGKFNTIYTSFKGEVLRTTTNVIVLVTAVSETEISFESTKQIPAGARVKMQSNFLDRVLEEPVDFYLRVYTMEKEGKNRWKGKGAFIALQEDVAKKIRALTTRGANLHEEEEVTEEEELEATEEKEFDESMAFKTKDGKIIRYGSDDDEDD